MPRPVEDHHFEATLRERLSGPDSALAIGLRAVLVAVIPDEEAVDAQQFGEEIKVGHLPVREMSTEGCDDVADAGGPELGDIEAALDDYDVLGIGCLGDRMIVVERQVEVVQLQAFLEPSIRPPLSV